MYIFLAALVLGSLQESKIELKDLSFETKTNIPFVVVHGKARELRGKITYEGLKIKEVQVEIPIESLSTGMSMKDRHMRERVFETDAKTLPPLKLLVKDVQCSGTAEQMRCPLKGSLSVRGIPKPFESMMRVKKTNQRFVGEGETNILLSNYNIPRPKQWGVELNDLIKIRYKVAY